MARGHKPGLRPLSCFSLGSNPLPVLPNESKQELYLGRGEAPQLRMTTTTKLRLDEMIREHLTWDFRIRRSADDRTSSSSMCLSIPAEHSKLTPATPSPLSSKTQLSARLPHPLHTQPADVDTTGTHRPDTPAHQGATGLTSHTLSWTRS